jgi:hypothetical protein
LQASMRWSQPRFRQLAASLPPACHQPAASQKNLPMSLPVTGSRATARSGRTDGSKTPITRLSFRLSVGWFENIIFETAAACPPARPPARPPACLPNHPPACLDADAWGPAAHPVPPLCRQILPKIPKSRSGSLVSSFCHICPTCAGTRQGGTCAPKQLPTPAAGTRVALAPPQRKRSRSVWMPIRAILGTVRQLQQVALALSAACTLAEQPAGL